jgi:hypothetical protein
VDISTPDPVPALACAPWPSCMRREYEDLRAVPLRSERLPTTRYHRGGWLAGWRLSCGGEEEVAATKAMTMAAGMSSSWRLREQVLDGAMRAGGGRRGRGDNGGGNVVTWGLGSGRHDKRGGADIERRCCWYRDDNDNGWDLPLPHTTGANATDAAMLPSPPTHDKIN